MKYKTSLLKSLLSLAALVILIFIVKRFPLMQNLSINSIVRFISRRRKYDELYFLAICTLRPVLVFVPSSMLSIAGGTVFGPVKGIILNMIGFFLSGTMAFYLSRFMGKDFVDRIVRGKALELDKALEKNGFKVMFLFRFPPIFPYDVFSYAAGLTKIKYKDFILGSLLGVIPETICYSFMGNKIGEPMTMMFLLPVMAIVAVTLITTWIFKRNKHIIELEQKDNGSCAL
jgi:uncharacterized membrane protein YdjX (TVP38/TMEM64 family)